MTDKVYLVKSKELPELKQALSYTGSSSDVNWNKYPTVPGDDPENQGLVKVKNDTHVGDYLLEQQRRFGSQLPTTDVVLRGDNGDVPCHSYILMNGSNYLNKMINDNILMVGPPNPHSPISITLMGYSHQIIQHAVNYFYRGFACCENLDELKDLLNFLEVKVAPKKVRMKKVPTFSPTLPIAILTDQEPEAGGEAGTNGGVTRPVRHIVDQEVPTSTRNLHQSTTNAESQPDNSNSASGVPSADSSADVNAVVHPILEEFDVPLPIFRKVSQTSLTRHIVKRIRRKSNGKKTKDSNPTSKKQDSEKPSGGNEDPERNSSEDKVDLETEGTKQKQDSNVSKPKKKSLLKSSESFTNSTDEAKTNPKSDTAISGTSNTENEHIESIEERVKKRRLLQRNKASSNGRSSPSVSSRQLRPRKVQKSPSTTSFQAGKNKSHPVSAPETPKKPARRPLKEIEDQINHNNDWMEEFDDSIDLVDVPSIHPNDDIYPDIEDRYKCYFCGLKYYSSLDLCIHSRQDCGKDLRQYYNLKTRCCYVCNNSLRSLSFYGIIRHVDECYLANNNSHFSCDNNRSASLETPAAPEPFEIRNDIDSEDGDGASLFNASPIDDSSSDSDPDDDQTPYIGNEERIPVGTLDVALQQIAEPARKKRKIVEPQAPPPCPSPVSVILVGEIPRDSPPRVKKEVPDSYLNCSREQAFDMMQELQREQEESEREKRNQSKTSTEANSRRRSEVVEGLENIITSKEQQRKESTAEKDQFLKRKRLQMETILPVSIKTEPETETCHTVSNVASDPLTSLTASSDRPTEPAENNENIENVRAVTELPQVPTAHETPITTASQPICTNSNASSVVSNSSCSVNTPQRINTPVPSDFFPLLASMDLTVTTVLTPDNSTPEIDNNEPLQTDNLVITSVVGSVAVPVATSAATAAESNRRPSSDCNSIEDPREANHSPFNPSGNRITMPPVLNNGFYANSMGMATITPIPATATSVPTTGFLQAAISGNVAASRGGLNSTTSVLKRYTRSYADAPPARLTRPGSDQRQDNPKNTYLGARIRMPAPQDNVFREPVPPRQSPGGARARFPRNVRAQLRQNISSPNANAGMRYPAANGPRIMTGGPAIIPQGPTAHGSIRNQGSGTRARAPRPIQMGNNNMSSGNPFQSGNLRADNPFINGGVHGFPPGLSVIQRAPAANRQSNATPRFNNSNGSYPGVGSSRDSPFSFTSPPSGPYINAGQCVHCGRVFQSASMLVDHFCTL